MTRSRAILQRADDGGAWLVVKLDHMPNLDHIDTVGMGVDRNTVDHTQHRVLPLCRTHHQNYHQLGQEKFSELYHVPANGIKLDAETLKKIRVKGNYES